MKLPDPAAWPRTTLVLVSAIWGSAWIGNQVIAEEVEPLRAGVLCFACGWLALGVVLILRLRRQPAAVHGAGAWRKLQTGTVLGCTMLALPFTLLLWAAQHGSGAWCPLLYAALPLGIGLRSGRFTPAAVMAVGAMLALLNGSLPLSPDRLLWTLPIVAAIALQGWSLGYAQASVEQASSVIGLYAQVQAATVILLVAQLLFGRALPAGAQPLRSEAVCAAGALGVLVYFAGYWACYRLLQVLEPSQVAASQWLQTLIAVGESAWLLHRVPSWTMLASAGVLIACAWSITQRDRGPLTLLHPDN